MAAQRIVLTSPWKLGLFVFLLVAGTGFGLLYAYLEVFGGQVELVGQNLQVLDTTIRMQGELTVRDAYIVLGSIALLSLVGYLAVITSARPLDRVVRGSRRRDQVLKRLGGVDDPRALDLDDFEDEPVIMKVLERWSRDADLANDAQLQVAAQREALSALTAQVQQAGQEPIVLDPEVQDPAVGSLVEAVNQFTRETAELAEQRLAEATRAAQTTPEPAAAARDPQWDAQRAPIGEAVRGLSEAEGELSDFVKSVSQRAGQIALAAQQLSRSETSGAVAPMAPAAESAQRSATRLTETRQVFEELAEQVNKLAITIALQVDRLGEAGGEMLDTVELVQSVSTRYQRLVAELRMCENDSVNTAEQLQKSGAAPAGDPSALAGLQQEAMVLDQNAEALREVLGRLESPLAQLRDAVGIAPSAAPRDVAPSAPSVPVAPSAPAEPVAAEAAEGARVYELAELGGQEIGGDADDPDAVYDLSNFGAVEL